MMITENQVESLFIKASHLYVCELISAANTYKFEN